MMSWGQFLLGNTTTSCLQILETLTAISAHPYSLITTGCRALYTATQVAKPTGKTTSNQASYSAHASHAGPLCQTLLVPPSKTAQASAQLKQVDCELAGALATNPSMRSYMQTNQDPLTCQVCNETKAPDE
jgi:hypothetical protein